MTVDRSHLSLGNSSTVVSVPWENEFKTEINELKDTVAELESVAGMMNGLQVEYTSANTVTIKEGQCQSDDNSVTIINTGSIVVSLAVSGENGLDTGSESANTWYYLWMVYNPDTDTVKAIFSTSASSPALPSGYTKKRLLPIAIRNNNSSNIIPFKIADSWPSQPRILFNVEIYTSTSETLVLSDGTATSYTDVNLSSFVPPVSKVAVIAVRSVDGNSRVSNIRTKGVSHNGIELNHTTTHTRYAFTQDVEVDSNQTIQYRWTGGAPSVGTRINVAGFIVTEITANNGAVAPLDVTRSNKFSKGYMNGLSVAYVNANSVQIAVGGCRDVDDTADMEVTSPITVALNTSGLDGLDTGSESANTWYYLWLIKNTTSGDVRAIFSTSSTSPTMPSGYTVKRLLPLAIRNDGSSNIIPFLHLPERKEVRFVVGFSGQGTPEETQKTSILSAGSSTTLVDVSAANYVPPISRMGIFFLRAVDQTSTTLRQAHILTKGSSGLRQEYIVEVRDGGRTSFLEVPVYTDANQTVQYKVSNANVNFSINVTGFVVTEV